MKLRQRPHKSPIGIKSKFSRAFSYLELAPPQISKCLTGSEGAKEWNRPTTTTYKIINIFQVKNVNVNAVYFHLSAEIFESVVACVASVPVRANESRVTRRRRAKKCKEGGGVHSPHFSRGPNAKTPSRGPNTGTLATQAKSVARSLFTINWGSDRECWQISAIICAASS